MLKQKLTSALFIILMLASIFAFSGCSSGSHPFDDFLSGNDKQNVADGDSDTEPAKDHEDDIEEFISFIESDSYADAIVKYNTDITGNARLEAEASQYIKSYLEDIAAGVLSGEYDETEANIMTTTVSKVYTSTNCTVDEYNELTQSVKDAIASKAAYKSGLALLDSQNYIDAIAEFEKVIPNDADYKDAIEKRELAIDTYKNDRIGKAADLVGDGDYLSAISVLKEAVNAIADDADLLAELNTCEKNYIANEIQRADEVFTDYTQYQEALNVVRAALQYYPEDETLLSKVDYYNMFAPVSLYDMTELRGSAGKKKKDTDSYGNEHEKSFFAFSFYTSTNITFDLGRNYNKFTATVYGRSKQNSSYNADIIIYGDGNVIYENSIKDNKTEPFPIELDITGISELKIVLQQGSGGIADQTGIGLTDMYIQRTEK